EEAHRDVEREALEQQWRPFEHRGDDARPPACGLCLRLADADRDEQRHDERDAVPGAEPEAVRRGEAERLEYRELGALRDHVGAYPGICSARSQRPMIHTSTPTSDT